MVEAESIMAAAARRRDMGCSGWRRSVPRRREEGPRRKADAKKRSRRSTRMNADQTAGEEAEEPHWTQIARIEPRWAQMKAGEWLARRRRGRGRETWEGEKGVRKKKKKKKKARTELEQFTAEEGTTVKPRRCAGRRRCA